MYYYKFKVFYDEVEDFVRDVDVLANTNFEDFHLFLYQCLGLQGNEFAAFSICDQKWNKQKEITLMDTSEEEEMTETPEYDDEDSFSTKSRLPRFVMKDAILKDFITEAMAKGIIDLLKVIKVKKYQEASSFWVLYNIILNQLLCCYLII